jgi:hypothetical protein
MRSEHHAMMRIVHERQDDIQSVIEDKVAVGEDNQVIVFARANKSVFQGLFK